MIKTIPLDIIISFVVGLLFALSAAPLLEKEESMINTYFIRALVFQAGIFFPIGLFLAWRYTAWSWMYLIEPHSHGKFLTFIAVLSYIPAMIAGFHIAFLTVKAGKKSQAYWYFAVGCFAIAAISYTMFGRLYHVQNAYLTPEKIYLAPGWFSFKLAGFNLSMLVIGVLFFGGISYVIRLNTADRHRVARQAFSTPVS